MKADWELEIERKVTESIQNRKIEEEKKQIARDEERKKNIPLINLVINLKTKSEVNQWLYCRV